MVDLLICWLDVDSRGFYSANFIPAWHRPFSNQLVAGTRVTKMCDLTLLFVKWILELYFCWHIFMLLCHWLYFQNGWQILDHGFGFCNQIHVTSPPAKLKPYFQVKTEMLITANARRQSKFSLITAFSGIWQPNANIFT